MKNKFYFLTIFFLSLFLSVHLAQAADIFCASSKTNVNPNQTFTVTLDTNTSGVSINSIEGVLSFPKDLLNAESVSSTGSIFSLWVDQPNFSNIDGTISFNGGVPDPGFTGTDGKILSVVFKAKKAGVANLSFASANIYANDGMGTNVISKKSGINININEEEKYNACVNHACTIVVGVGVNECTKDADCLPIPKHNACVNNACVLVEGEDENECTSNIDCQITISHKACVNNACTSITGGGADECLSLIHI